MAKWTAGENERESAMRAERWTDDREMNTRTDSEMNVTVSLSLCLSICLSVCISFSSLFLSVSLSLSFSLTCQNFLPKSRLFLFQGNFVYQPKWMHICTLPVCLVLSLSLCLLSFSFSLSLSDYVALSLSLSLSLFFYFLVKSVTFS